MRQERTVQARRQPAVHPAASVRHRRRPARAPCPGPRAASRAAVHGENLLCMGLFLRFFATPPPPRGGNHPDHGLPAGVDMLDRDLLLALAAMAVESLRRRGIGAESSLAWLRLSCRLSNVWSWIMARRQHAIAASWGRDRLGRHHAFRLVLRCCRPARRSRRSPACTAPRGSHRSPGAPVSPVSRADSSTRPTATPCERQSGRVRASLAPGKPPGHRNRLSFVVERR
jgi:hypothetical protein